MRIISLSTKVTYLVDLGLNDHLIPVVFRVPRVDVFHWDETEDSEETDEDCRLQTTTNLSVTLSLSLSRPQQHWPVWLEGPHYHSDIT